MRPQRILVPAVIALLLGAIAPLASNASASRSAGLPAAAAAPRTGGAHHQFALTTPGGRAGDLFGSAVAIHKNIAVVGAPFRTVNGHKRQGAAYIFVKPASGWAHAKVTAVLTVAKGKGKDYFGAAVAIAGHTIAISSPLVTSGTNVHEGSVYLFTKPAAGWGALHHPTGRLFPSDRTSGDAFGGSLAGSGNTFVVGAPFHVVGQHPKQGAAYVFQRPAGGWKPHTVQTAELVASDGVPGTELGYSVAISGKTVVAGAPYVKVGHHVGAGAAYVFGKPGSGWRNAVDTAKLTVRHPVASQYLGDSVAVSGSTVAAGAPDTKVGTNKLQGASYVFTTPGSGWHDTHQSATLTVSPGDPKAYFGQGLAASGNRIVGTAFGLASLFYQPAGHWHGTKHQRAQLSGANPLDFLGSAVAMSGSTIIAGAPTQLVGRHKYQGAAYIYLR